MATAAIPKTAMYLTFGLGSEVFAVDVSSVREVLDVASITKVPRTPDFMLGVINLRGNVVPVVDMRLKLGMTKTEHTVNTCVIVVEIDIDGTSTVIGALSDSVEEVFEMAPDRIEPPPRIGTAINTDFIRGIGKNEGQFIIILDIDKVFSVEELRGIDAAGEDSPGAD